MTIQEAIQWHNETSHSFWTEEEAEKDREWRDIVTQALNKQIPKKPILHELGYVCPTCNAGEESVIFNDGVSLSYGYKCCTSCGQRLSWEGTDIKEHE